MRELDALLSKIDKRLNTKFQIDAALHGIKLPKQNQEPAEPVSIHENEAKAMDEALQRAKLKKQEQFARLYGK